MNFLKEIHSFKKCAKNGRGIKDKSCLRASRPKVYFERCKTGGELSQPLKENYLFNAFKVRIKFLRIFIKIWFGTSNDILCY